jgi:hypothetical protein
MRIHRRVPIIGLVTSVGVGLLIAALAGYGCSAGGDGTEFGADDDDGAGASGAGSGTGAFGGSFFDGGPSGGSGGDCSEAAKLIYVIDDVNNFYKFDPTMASPSAFQLVGTLNCASTGTPNSMAVSREGYAYVLFGESDPYFPDTYNCSAVNKVDIQTAQCLGPTPFQCGAKGFEKFGMGYATESDQSTKETLYIGNSLTPALGSIDVTTGAVQSLGTMPNMGPEFTGNSVGELWGFFPYESPAAAIKLNKSNGQALQTLSLSSLPDANQGLSMAWAFAYWGGEFYIFYMVSPPDSSSNVYKLNYNGTVTKYIANTGIVIVGAGVSTCAPITPPN